MRVRGNSKNRNLYASRSFGISILALGMTSWPGVALAQEIEAGFESPGSAALLARNDRNVVVYNTTSQLPSGTAAAGALIALNQTALAPHIPNLTAAFTYNGRKYLFLTTGQYLALDARTDAIVEQPSYISNSNWRGMHPYRNQIDAALRFKGNSVLFFLRNGQFIEYDMAQRQITNGPMAMSNPLFGLPSLQNVAGEITGALRWNNDQAVIFLRGQRHLIFNFRGVLASGSPTNNLGSQFAQPQAFTGAFPRPGAGGYLRPGTGAFPRPGAAPYPSPYPVPGTGAYPAPGTGGYPGPGAGVYPAPGAGGYPTPVTGGYPRPGVGGYPTPGTGGYPAPGTGGYPRPGVGGYPTPGAGGYPTPGTGGYPRPGAGGYPAPGAGGYPTPGAGGYPRPGAGGYPTPIAGNTSAARQAAVKDAVDTIVTAAGAQGYTQVNRLTGLLGNRTTSPNRAIGRLDSGYTYTIVATGDGQTDFMELVILDGRGGRINSTPVPGVGRGKELDITPPSTQFYNAVVTMTKCNASPCHWALTVLRAPKGGSRSGVTPPVARPANPGIANPGIASPSLPPSANLSAPRLTWDEPNKLAIFQTSGMLNNSQGQNAQLIVRFEVLTAGNWISVPDGGDPSYSFNGKAVAKESFAASTNAFQVGSLRATIPWDDFNIEATPGAPVTYQMRATSEIWLNGRQVGRSTAAPFQFRY